MKMIQHIILVFFISSLALSRGIKEHAEELLNYTFPNHDIILTEYQIPTNIKLDIQKKTKQKFYRDNLYVWKILNSDMLVGIAVIDNVKGKSMPITFLTIFDDEANIMNNHIIKYREPYGGEISSKSWLKQFIGKNKNSSYNPGRDIDGISGATISVNSISKGINKLSLLAPDLLNDLK